jgi:hypothetical protein
MIKTYKIDKNFKGLKSYYIFLIVLIYIYGRNPKAFQET